MTKYGLARSLTDDLMEMKARQDRRHERERVELRAIIAKALVVEKSLRADGNPARALLALGMTTDEAATSSAAD